MAAGKSTLARRLAAEYNAVLLVEDEWLMRLYPEEIVDLAGYVKYSTRLKAALAGHITALLSRGVSVVLDFPGNTREMRRWFRHLFEQGNAAHELHFVDARDELCKRQLKERSRNQPEGAAFTSEAEFDAITKYFQPPTADEGFKIIRHECLG